jgi:hypothetical protein
MRDRKTLYEHYAGMFPSQEIFNETLNQCTENYECLVIHKSSRSNQLEDQVYWYKAEPHETFRIGYDVFWQHNKKYYDTSYDTTLNGGAIGGKRPGQKVKGKYNVTIKKSG